MIKTDMAMFANRRTAAMKYSAKVQAERIAKEEARREKIGTIKAFIVGLLVIIGAGIAGTVTDRPMETNATEMTKTTETYLICDVEMYCYNNDFKGNTDLYCEMPNGDLEIFTIKDAPERKCTLVTFKTENLDDYNTYEVVAVR